MNNNKNYDNRCFFLLQGLREEVGSLNNRIQELESQNRALTSMLMHQLRGDTTASFSETDHSSSSNHQLALEDSSKENKEQFEGNSTSADVSPSNLMRTSLAFKHCNSFNSEVLSGTSNNDSPNDSTSEKVVSRIEKHLSTGAEILGILLLFIYYYHYQLKHNLNVFVNTTFILDMYHRYEIFIRRQKKTSSTNKAVDRIERYRSNAKEIDRSAQFSRFGFVGTAPETRIAKFTITHTSSGEVSKIQTDSR